MKDRQILILGVAATAILLVGGAFWLNRGPSGGDEFAQCRTGVVAGGAGALGGAFELTDETGKRVTDTQVFTKPSLLYFGYTYCPDVCPLDSARNAEALDVLDEQGIDAQAVFITVDPKRDTPEVVADFTENLHEKMIGLTGTLAETDAASKLWKNYYKLNDDGTDFYLVDHATNTYLVLPEKGTVEFFRRDLSPDELAERVACFVEAS
ncbi:SCO family protein [Paracoccus aurantiacus]|uniref:SCO family protein n=1 Tax=Paracoccus aurantiacus TaxID=2599412 RepID=A0A5C6S089_9RHOB|nr:SCO family protein [Paracoccus aurantiacus]TXB67814.1 SCO family protein [Paracoccus aurantiacus]